MGRPRKTLTKEQTAQVEALAAFLTVAQMADYFGMAQSTFHALMKRNRKVYEAYARGRARAIGNVARGLIKQANAGNVQAAKFYLETQAGWRSKQEVDVTVTDPASKLREAFLGDEGDESGE